MGGVTSTQSWKPHPLKQALRHKQPALGSKPPNLQGAEKESYSDRNSQRDPELPVAAACRPAWMNKGEKFV